MHLPRLLTMAVAAVSGVSAVRAADVGTFAAAPPLQPVFARPAVDGANGKIEVFGGTAASSDLLGRSNDGVFGGAASMTVPLGHAFGVQVDVLGAARDGGFQGGAGGHLFWRDPGLGLVGVYGAFAANNKTDFQRARIGAEGEFYYGRFTLSGVAGLERTYASSFPLSGGLVSDLGDKTRFFNIADFAFYPLDNLRIAVGHRYIAGTHAGAAGLEYQFASKAGFGYSAYVEARLGEDRYRAVWAGLRVYFGNKDKTLIMRHREDDPAVFLQEDLHAPRGLEQQSLTKAALTKIAVDPVFRPVQN